MSKNPEKVLPQNHTPSLRHVEEVESKIPIKG
jgi:hypothetical protein